MLRQELQETRETLAARDAEVDELKARLAELEQLQQQQQQLIELKDSELAAVQQRLAESNQQPAPTLAQANQPESATPASQEAGGGAPWLWIGLGVVLLIAAALAWARIRRDGAAPAGRSPGGRAPAPGAGAGTGAGTASARRGGPPLPTWHAGDGAAGATAVDSAAEPPREVEDPAVTEVAPAPEPVAEPDTTGHGLSPAPEPAPAPTDPGSPEALTGVGERLELAKAYVELGDIETARELLGEVVAAGSAQESDEAARLLQELA